MPQMGPILWLNLFCFFIICLIVFLIMNFYTKTTMKNKEVLTLKPKKNFFWKW